MLLPFFFGEMFFDPCMSYNRRRSKRLKKNSGVVAFATFNIFIFPHRFESKKRTKKNGKWHHDVALKVPNCWGDLFFFSSKTTTNKQEKGRKMTPSHDFFSSQRGWVGTFLCVFETLLIKNHVRGPILEAKNQVIQSDLFIPYILEVTWPIKGSHRIAR